MINFIKGLAVLIVAIVMGLVFAVVAAVMFVCDVGKSAGRERTK